jgi:hypothetical protein
MKTKIVFVSFCMAIAACGQSSDKKSPQEQAAATCAAEAKVLIGEKTYTLDLNALAQSAKLTGDTWQLQVPVTIEPGLRGEVKQTLVCHVRNQDGKPSVITKINFIYL